MKGFFYCQRAGHSSLRLNDLIVLPFFCVRKNKGYSVSLNQMSEFPLNFYENSENSLHILFQSFF